MQKLILAAVLGGCAPKEIPSTETDQVDAVSDACELADSTYVVCACDVNVTWAKVRTDLNGDGLSSTDLEQMLTVIVDVPPDELEERCGSGLYQTDVTSLTITDVRGVSSSVIPKKLMANDGQTRLIAWFDGEGKPRRSLIVAVTDSGTDTLTLED